MRFEILLDHKEKSWFFYLQPSRSYYLEFVSCDFFYFIFFQTLIFLEFEYQVFECFKDFEFLLKSFMFLFH